MPRTLALGVPSLAPNLVSSVPTLRCWLKADALALADNAAVVTWTDSHTSANSPTQATGTAQPLNKTNIINGLPVVRFDGVDDRLRWLASSPMSMRNVPGGTAVMVAARLTGAVSENRFLAIPVGLGGSAAIRFAITSNAASYELLTRRLDADALNRIGTAGPVTSVDMFYIISVVADYTRGRREIYINGVLVDSITGLSTGNTTDLNSGTQPTLGGDADTVITRPSKCDMAELAVFTSALSPFDRRSIEKYLSVKYNLPWYGGLRAAAVNRVASVSRGVAVGRVLVT